MTFDFAIFKYEKSATDVSNRCGFIVSKPSDNYAILEVDDNNGRDVEVIEDILKTIRSEYDSKLRELCTKNGLKFKNFKADKVKDLEIL